MPRWTFHVAIMLTLHLTLTLTLAFASVGCGGHAPPEESASPPRVAVTTAMASVESRSVTEELPGTVAPVRAVRLQARVLGVVSAIDVTPGSAVHAGDVLVELDARELSAQRDQARALAVQAAADQERATRLIAKQAMTRAEYDAVEARAAQAAAVAQEAEIRVGYTRITAPFGGVVVRKLVEIGDLVSPGLQLLELEDPDALRLEVAIPESLANGVREGSSLPAHVDAAGFAGDAPVVEVIQAADPVSRSVLVKLALPARAPGLHAGQFGRIAVLAARGSALAVPAAAVVRRGQFDAVFVVQGQVARLRLVRLSGSDGGRAWVSAGLDAGESVIIGPARTLADGQPVTVR